MTARAIKGTTDSQKSTLDLAALSAIDEEVIDVSGQLITMTALVPADIEKCRKLIASRKLDQTLAMEYMTFLSMKKKHPEVTWYNFQNLNFRVVNKLMAIMAVQNGFDETFRVFGDIGGTSTEVEEDYSEIELD